MKTEDKIWGILLSIISAIIALIPVWVFIGIRILLSPKGFWQNFFLLGLGIWSLGIIQIILLVLLGIWLWAIWS